MAVANHMKNSEQIFEEFRDIFKDSRLTRLICKMSVTESEDSGIELDRHFQVVDQRIKNLKTDFKKIINLLRELVKAKTCFSEKVDECLYVNKKLSESMEDHPVSQINDDYFTFRCHYFFHHLISLKFLYLMAFVFLAAFLFSPAIPEYLFIMNKPYLSLVACFFYCLSKFNVLVKSVLKKPWEYEAMYKPLRSKVMPWISKSEEVGEMLSRTFALDVQVLIFRSWRSYLKEIHKPEYSDFKTAMLKATIRKIFQIEELRMRYGRSLLPIVATFLIVKLLLDRDNRHIIQYATKTRHIRASLLKYKMEVCHEKINIGSDFDKARRKLRREGLLFVNVNALLVDHMNGSEKVEIE